MNDDFKYKFDDIKKQELGEPTPQLIADESTSGPASTTPSNQTVYAASKFEHDLLHCVRLATSCGVDWDEMDGDDRARTCKTCGYSVLKLENESPATLTKFIADVHGTVYDPVYRRPDGTYMLGNCFIPRFYPRHEQATGLFLKAFLWLLFTSFIASVGSCQFSTDGYSIGPFILTKYCPIWLSSMVYLACITWHAVGCLWLARVPLKFSSALPMVTTIILFTVPFVLSPFFHNSMAINMARILTPQSYEEYYSHTLSSSFDTVVRQLNQLNSYANSH